MKADKYCDTIYAPATPPGRSGVAVIRASGPQAAEGLNALLQKPDGFGPAPEIMLKSLLHPETRALIDRALVLRFQAPASFTGEDVVEYHIHGGPAVMKDMLEALSTLPEHRLAEPGEFTRRAFENGKMDLTAAEAVADLINAETQAQKAQALDQLHGHLAALYQGWTDRLTQALAHLEADIEFPDEDMPDGIAPGLIAEANVLAAEIKTHLNDNRRGERLRDGIKIAVIGAPNAGKSSLLNALAQREAAIVSPLAGTTRDIVEVHLDLAGLPATILDTAGLRPDTLEAGPQAEIEAEGIRRALDAAQNADIKLLLFDGQTSNPDPHTMRLIDGNALPVINKSDMELRLGSVPGALNISAKTGENLPALIEEITRRAKNLIGTREAPALTRRRHRVALEDAHAALQRASSAVLPELVAEDMRLALRALGRITGRVDVEDLLDKIFRDFCIGK